jgi:hypothetical protein
MANLTNYIDAMSRSFTATGTIAAGQPVGIDGALAGAGDPILGIAKHDVTTDDVDSVLVVGECQVTSGAAITAGADLEINGAGKFITLASGVKVGRALQAASGANKTIQAYINAI